MGCKFISIDASTKKTGIAIFIDGEYKNSKLINCESISDDYSRTSYIIQSILTILDTERPNVLYMEETVVERNAKTQRTLSQIQGAVWGWCILNDCDFETIRPTEWRKLVGINSGKKKRDVLKAESISLVKNIYKLDVSDDEAEAILIGIAAINKWN